MFCRVAEVAAISIATAGRLGGCMRALHPGGRRALWSLPSTLALPFIPTGLNGSNSSEGATQAPSSHSVLYWACWQPARATAATAVDVAVTTCHLEPDSSFVLLQICQPSPFLPPPIRHKSSLLLSIEKSELDLFICFFFSFRSLHWVQVDGRDKRDSRCCLLSKSLKQNSSSWFYLEIYSLYEFIISWDFSRINSP